MSDFDPNEVVETYSKASRGPWGVIDGTTVNSPDGEIASARTEVDAHFIASCRQAIPNLIRYIAALQRELDYHSSENDRLQSSLTFLQEMVARAADERWQIAAWIDLAIAEIDNEAHCDALPDLAARLRGNTWLADKIRLMEKFDKEYRNG